MLQQITKLARSITIEPVAFLFMVATSTVYGIQAITNLLIWKICTKELNFTEEVCANLSADANEDYENEVQRELQKFELVQTYLDIGPALIYVFVAGGLSDKFGRKPLLLLPIFGQFLDGLLYLLNYWYQRVFSKLKLKFID